MMTGFAFLFVVRFLEDCSGSGAQLEEIGGNEREKTRQTVHC